MRLNRQNACFFFFGLLIAGKLSAQPQKLYLNPKASGAASQSKFIEITRFIPLESPSEKIGTYSGLYVTKNYWVIYNYREKKIQFLTRQGKFVKTIDLKKYGETSLLYDSKDETLKFNIKNKNYTLTSKDLVKIRADYARKSNQKYFRNYMIDLNDESLEIKRIPTDPYFIINARRFYDDFYYLSDLSINPRAKDTSGYELQILKDYKPTRSFLPFNKTNDKRFEYPSMTPGFQMYLSDTDTAYIKYTARQFNPTIYKLNKDSLWPVYEIVLPLENALPPSFFNKGFRSKSDWENFQNNNGAVFYSINGVKDIGKHLFFGISYMRNYESFVYDKSEAKFYKTKMIKADSSQYNIQLLQNGLGSYSNGSYYALVPADGLVDFYAKNKNKKQQYPPELQAYLNTATKNSNPVIVEYKIKE